jgi:predicted RNA-binding Zn-ribbon protein involved in translation (DUF1610 family)
MSRRSKARYDKKCPACGAEFNPADTPSFRPHFPCPECGVELQYATQHKLLVTVFSVVVAAGPPFILGMRGLTYIFSGIFTAPLAWLLIVLIVDQIDPPPTQKYQRKSGKDTYLRLDWSCLSLWNTCKRTAIIS